MSKFFEGQPSPNFRTAMRVTKLYRALKAELDGLEGQKESSGSTTQDSADHLAHSHKICGHLRKLAHALISAEEEGRTQLGKVLQNDILQMMVGLHIRLLNLDRDVSTEGSLIKNEIAMTQRMVKESSDILCGMPDSKTNEC